VSPPATGVANPDRINSPTALDLQNAKANPKQ
jgi:hypothetical protein